MTTQWRSARPGLLKVASAAVLGVPPVIPASALGREGRTAPGERIGVQIRVLRAKTQGFTLVELLVAIAVLGLLITIIAPSLSRARAMARSTECRGKLHGAAMAMQIYLNRSKGVMPTAAAMPSLGLNDDPPIADVLGEFLSGRDALRCPEDTVKEYWRTEGSSYEYQTILSGRRARRRRPNAPSRSRATRRRAGRALR